jgi:hypothetical protein
MRKYINFINESKDKEKKVQEKSDIIVDILNGKFDIIDKSDKIDKSKLKEKYISDIKEEKNTIMVGEKLKEFRAQFGKEEANNLSKELKLRIVFL